VRSERNVGEEREEGVKEREADGDLKFFERLGGVGGCGLGMGSDLGCGVCLPAGGAWLCG
jgi:hypothetical protein